MSETTKHNIMGDRVIVDSENSWGQLFNSSQVKSPLLAPAVFIMVLFIAVRNYDLIERFISE